MQLVSISLVVVRDRQRKNIAPKPLDELADSIVATALLHPPVCWRDNASGKYILTVGERRFRAIQKINERKPYPGFKCGDVIVPQGQLPITELGDFIDEVGRFEAELHENVYRVDLDWKERAQALSDLHEMRLKSNPKQTRTDTAKELVSQGVTESVPAAAKQIKQAQTIAANLGNAKIANARNESEALSLIYRAQEEAALAELAKRRLAALPASEKLVEIRNGDLLKELPLLTPQSFDLLLADPPYGIDAGSAGFRARTVHHHNYADDPTTARELYATILEQGFRVTKSRANIFMFCAIEYFDYLKQTAANMAWVPFNRPLIWQKSDSEGLAPWGGIGPRITTEFIFYATKGQRGLSASPIDVFRINRVSRGERTHAAEKPVELLRKLIECSTLPGDSVLDPCCGSGSTIVACRDSKRRGLGIEVDSDYFTTAMANVFGDGEESSGSDEDVQEESSSNRSVATLLD